MDIKFTSQLMMVMGFVWGALGSGLARADNGCAKAEVVMGDGCQNLVVKFDISACGDSALVGKPKVKCHKDGTTADISQESSRFRYKGTLKSQESWGKVTWAVGDIQQKTLHRDRGEGVAQESMISKLTTPSTRVVADHGAAPVVASVVVPPATPVLPRAVAAEPPTSPAPPGKPDAPPVAPPAPPTPGITFSGMFDGYYSYNFNRPAPVAGTSSLVGGGNNLRYYDLYHNQMTVNLAELTMKKTGSSVSFVADLDFGETADLNAAGVGLSSSGGPIIASVDEVSKHIGQAYISYTPASAPALSIDFGKMDTHVGLETVKSKDNFQYSRSSTFSFGMPLWHTGLHVGYAFVPNRFSAGIYVYNGWNSIYDNNSAKTLGAQLKFTPTDALTVIYNFVGGAEQATSNGNLRIVNELNATYAWNPSFTTALELLAGQEDGVALGSGNIGKASWNGGSLHAKLQVAPWYWISPRFEIYHDAQGYTLGGDAQTLYGYTLTNAFDLGQGLEVRVEVRTDHSTSRTRFVGADGVSANQTTATLGLVLSL